MSELRDGAKIYDTPKYDGYERKACYPGYNGGYVEHTPTCSIGSSCEFTGYWERQIYNELLSLYDFEMPDNWDRNYALWILFREGYFALIEPPEKVFGIIPQECHFEGLNVFYQPTKVLVCNPLLRKRADYRIGKNCAVIKLTPDYRGVWDLVHLHAENLGLITQALRMAILNSRVADAFLTDNKAAAQAFMGMQELIDRGQPAFALMSQQFKSSDGKNPFYEIHNEVGRNYIVDKLMADLEHEWNQTLREIGIPVLSDKKERQITSEVSVAVENAMTLSDVWLDNLQDSIEKAKKVFPNLNFSVTRHTQEVANNELG